MTLEEIIDRIKDLKDIVYEVYIQNDIMFISTNFLDNRNDIIEILLWINDDDIFLSDYNLIYNEFELQESLTQDSILKNIHKCTTSLPIVQYFSESKQLVCKSNINNIRRDMFYFCQSIIRHLDLIYGYTNFLSLCQLYN